MLAKRIVSKRYVPVSVLCVCVFIDIHESELMSVTRYTRTDHKRIWTSLWIALESHWTKYSSSPPNWIVRVRWTTISNRTTRNPQRNSCWAPPISIVSTIFCETHHSVCPSWLQSQTPWRCVKPPWDRTVKWTRTRVFSTWSRTRRCFWRTTRPRIVFSHFFSMMMMMMMMW